MKKLTARQQEIFDLLVAFQKERGYPPSQKEVADLMGAKSPNAATELLRSLQRKGVITLAPGVSRGITIISPGIEDEAISLIRSLVDGDEYAREHAIAFLESRGVEV